MTTIWMEQTSHIETETISMTVSVGEEEDLSKATVLSGTFKNVLEAVRYLIQENESIERLHWKRKGMAAHNAVVIGPRPTLLSLLENGLAEAFSPPDVRVIVGPPSSYVPLRAGLDEAEQFMGNILLLRRRGILVHCPCCNVDRDYTKPCLNCGSTLPMTPRTEWYVSVDTERLLEEPVDVFFVPGLSHPLPIPREKLRDAFESWKTELKELRNAGYSY